ncbi:MAG: Dabb family protein [Pirellulales bacterium]
MAQSSEQAPKVAHMVFFTLKDDSPAARQKMTDACQKYLSDHPGTAYFSAGTRAEQFDRPVNDKEFHIALHVVFNTQADHDRYQTAEKHLKFIEENRDNWEEVRVFDSHVK